MAKSPDAFRTISEVADWLGIQAHVLRFWESKFAPVKPIKRAGGRRYYRPADMLLLGGIKKLLHDDGLTIKGVQKILREQGIAHVSELSNSIDEAALSIEVEVEDVSATVLQFQSNFDLEPDDEPKAEEAPITAHQDDVEDTNEADILAVSETSPEPAVEVETPEPEDLAEAAVLPSFLSRPSEEKEDVTAPISAPSAPQPEIPRAIIVDAPDPGPDDTLTYSPGPLGQLAGLDYLTTEQAEEIAPLADKLRAWLTRTDAA